jgi:hypothetical protein
MTSSRTRQQAYHAIHPSNHHPDVKFLFIILTGTFIVDLCNAKKGSRTIYVNIPQVIAVGHVVTVKFHGWRGKAGLDGEGHRRFRRREGRILSDTGPVNRY